MYSALIILIGLGLGIDGLLDHDVGEPVEPEGHEALNTVAADHVIPPDGGGGEDTVLAADVLVNGLFEGHSGGVPADLLVVELVGEGLQLGLLLGGGGEGKVLPFSTGILAHIKLNTPGAGGELLCGCHDFSPFFLRPAAPCDTIKGRKGALVLVGLGLLHFPLSVLAHRERFFSVLAYVQPVLQCILKNARQAQPRSGGLVVQPLGKTHSALYGLIALDSSKNQIYKLIILGLY